MQADNVVTWDRVVLLAILVVGVERVFARVLVAVIYAEILIQYYDTIHSPEKTVNKGLSRDDANVAALHKGTRIAMHLLSKNMADIMELAQGDETAIPEIEPTPSSSSNATI